MLLTQECSKQASPFNNDNDKSITAAPDKILTAVDLPPELWANQILEFLTMDDILNCSIVDKRFFMEQVSPLVLTLVVTSSANLRVAPHALQKKRFKGVRMIRIYCLFQDYNNPEFNEETCRHFLVQFLACFPMLGCVDLSAGKRKVKNLPGHSFIAYYEPKVRTKKNCAALNNLLNQLCNAFSTGQLDSEVEFNGMCGSIEKQDDCRCCRTVCYSFPIKSVTQADFGAPCLDSKARMEIAMGRYVDDSMLQTWQLDTLLCETLVCKYKGGITSDGFVAILFPKDTLYYMDWLIEKGGNPRQPELRKILTTWKKLPSGEVPFGFVNDDPTALRRMDSNTFQNLNRLGMDLSEKYFNLVDLPRRR